MGVTKEKTPLDVWLKFSTDDNEEVEFEANTYETTNGYAVEWYHVDVGQTSGRRFDTYEEAADWLEKQGFVDFTS